MIEGLKPYPEYKNSEVLSVGDIPWHWKMIRSGYLFREVIDTGHPNLELLSIDRFRGIIRQSDIGRKERASKDRSLYKRIRKGQLGYNLMNAFMGSIGISRYEGIISPAYAVGQPKKKMNPWYYHHLYRSPIYSAEINRYSYGIMYERNRLYFDYFKRIPVPYPPIDEQNKIVTVIYQKGKEFQNLINTKLRIIDLLIEQKRAIISRIVTRGLDPDVRLKPSGIEWFGEIPEHWKVSRLRDVAKLIVSNVDKKTIKGEIPIRLCNYVDIYKNDLVHKEMPFMLATATESEIIKFRIQEDDVIITKDSEEWQDIGVPAYVTYEAPDLICGYHLAIIRPYSTIMKGKYLHWQLMSNALQIQFSIRANGVTRYGLSHGGIKDVSLLAPPLNEQSLIVRNVDYATSDINSTISDTNHEISLLKEYRTRLITDIVTGKVDSRLLKTDMILGIEPEDQSEEFEDDTVIDSEDIDQLMD